MYSVSGAQNSVFGMNTNNTVSKSSGNGKLLLISDLEGCQPYGPPPAKAELARFMCEQPFFNEVDKFLSNNPKNKVAFLGDYFDQGDKVVDSINGIMGLYNKYTSRVIIIVGNRDVNKFRLVYEMKANPETVGTKKWPTWDDTTDRPDIKPPGSKFYTDLPSKTNLKDRLAFILAKSMGANAPSGNVNLHKDLNPLQAGYLLLKIFSDARANEFKEANLKNGNVNVNYDIDTTYESFIKNARKLFEVAEIVHYDSDFQTLMSHAGGMDTFLFHTDKYYEKIKKAINDETTYFDKIEKARLMLMDPPTNNKNNNRANIKEKTTKFVAETYNAPLKKVVSEAFSGTETPSADFFLLQALGLKPDEGRHFVSFIQSCDNSSCKGPNGKDSGSVYDGYSEFQGILLSNENNVKVLASGHAPHCTPVPLIYTRSDCPGDIPLLYVLNDTSNGYRPKSRVKDISTYPLAYVNEGGMGAGVGMLPSMVAKDMEGDDFGPMFGEWTASTAPKFMLDSNTVQYVNGTLSFPGRPLAFPAFFAPAVLKKSTAGGRRRNKKTRKAKKANRKGRKTRKY